MRKMPIIATLLLFSLAACAAPKTPLPPRQEPPATQPPAEQLSQQPTVSPVQADGTLLYIAGTMHIETLDNSWPRDAEAFLAFLKAVTDAGMRWSIGADIGWLQRGPDAQQIVQRSADMGVQWDIHTHKMQDAAQTAAILSGWGVTPTSVYSGLLVEELDNLNQSFNYQGVNWTPGAIWGAVFCPGHRPGCDDLSLGIYRPASSAQYEVHDPNGRFINVRGGSHQLVDAETLAATVASGAYDVPVIGFTVMVDPDTLRVAKTDTDDLMAILSFVERLKQNPQVRWATIAETAAAWEQAGGVPIQIPQE